MSIQLFRLAAALSVVAAPAVALASGPESGGPIATQAAVNTAPAASAAPAPAANTSAAAALRAAVLPPKSAVAAPATTTAAPPAATSIATLPAATSPASASSAAPAQATAGASVYGDAAAAQPTALAIGLTVKDRTGASIGQVTSIDDDSKLGQLVTVQMGQESFRLSADRFGLWGGAATINLTQADIEAQLHPKR